MAFEKACRLSDLQEGVPLPVTLGRRRIAVMRWRGDVYAVRDSCAHQNVSFAGGRVEPHIEGTGKPGELVASADEPVLACPWHSFKYDLRTGKCVADPRFRVRTYPVSVEDAIVYVDVSARKHRSPAHAGSA